jgi:hypothetical protein
MLPDEAKGSTALNIAVSGFRAFGLGGAAPRVRVSLGDSTKSCGCPEAALFAQSSTTRSNRETDRPDWRIQCGGLARRQPVTRDRVSVSTLIETARSPKGIDDCNAFEGATIA